MVNVDRLFARIGYDGGREPTLETLAALQERFLLAVPFENLDIHLGCKIVLDVARFERKIVEERRGGFCYELNSLFHGLLRALGYRVKFASARMATPDGFAPDFGHMILIAELDGRQYLVDVGNGQSVRAPLAIPGGQASTPEGITYRVGPFDDAFALYFRDGAGEETPRFRFDTTPRAFAEYAGMCEFQQTSPESRFTQRIAVTQATASGRVTLVDRTLTVIEDGATRTFAIEDGAALRACLRDWFGLDVGDQQLRRPLDEAGA